MQIWNTSIEIETRFYKHIFFCLLLAFFGFFFCSGSSLAAGSDVWGEETLSGPPLPPRDERPDVLERRQKQSNS